MGYVVYDGQGLMELEYTHHRISIVVMEGNRVFSIVDDGYAYVGLFASDGFLELFL